MPTPRPYHEFAAVLLTAALSVLLGLGVLLAGPHEQGIVAVAGTGLLFGFAWVAVNFIGRPLPPPPPDPPGAPPEPPRADPSVQTPSPYEHVEGDVLKLRRPPARRA